MNARSAQDEFLDMMRQETEKPDLSFEDAIRLPLANNLYKLVVRNQQTTPPSNDPATSAPAPSDAPSVATLASSPAVIQAALCDTFDLSELGASDAERSALIAAGDIVMVDGKRRLRLNDSARAKVIASAANSDAYQSILKRSDDNADKQDARSSDAVRLPTLWLRSFLSGGFSNLDRARPADLAAALAARQRLRQVSNLPSNVPSIADLERRVAFAELLEPLRLLVGARRPEDRTTSRSDRFVGRNEELTRLRAFVDELSPQNIRERLTRFATRKTQQLLGAEGPNLIVVQADGGLGKSALLAKFVLDHALNQNRQFPFAYLDFDRAALSATEPLLLLVEIARQVGLQYPNAQNEFAALSDGIRQDRLPLPEQSKRRDVAIRDPYANFVEILRKHATQSERAFLLVFDTLELVQWNPVAMDRLASMLNEFRNKGLVELRVVASGRADIPELRAAAGASRTSTNIQLPPLSTEEATEMADLLGHAALGDSWQRAWATAIAGQKPSSGSFYEIFRRVLTPREDVRHEPLTVRVAVDLVVQAKADGRVAELIRDIEDMSEKGQKDLAARLYERRILNHVRDKRARKLAWPGLVLRRVTLEIARDFLAPLCGLGPNEVDDAYRALGEEVWMVVREGNALKHRPDLRARTLPLMRANQPDLFDKVARAAAGYFGGFRDRSADDRAEWIYHRLLAGEEMKSVHPDITPAVFSALGGAEQDFPPNSDAASYIAARTARARMPPNRIRSLALNDALYHLSATSQSVFGLDDNTIDAISLEVSDRLAHALDTIDPDLYPWAEALWIKTGSWDRPRRRLDGDLPRLVWRALLFRITRSSPPLPRPQIQELLKQCTERMGMPDTQDDSLGLRTTVQALALARIAGSSEFNKIDERTAGMLRRIKVNPLPSMQAALRTAIVFGNVCQTPALELWLSGRRHGSYDRVQAATISTAELQALAALAPYAGDLLTVVRKDSKASPFRIMDERIVSSAAQVMEEFAYKLAGSSESSTGLRMARVFACRDEDWIIPFGYAADRATEGFISGPIRERLLSYSEPLASSSVRTQDLSLDFVGAMRIADEAGDLAGFAAFVLEQAQPLPKERKADLARLLEYRDRWSETVAGLLAGPDAGPSDEAVRSTMLNPPPRPGRVVHDDDPQKDRWGGESQRDGRIVRAVLESTESEVFYFSLIVESTDGTPLEAPVVFHLHDTFPRNVVHIRRIVDGNRAELNDWNAYGVFTVGVQVKTGKGDWTSLELDLLNLPGLPQRFRKR